MTNATFFVIFVSLLFHKVTVLSQYVCPSEEWIQCSTLTSSAQSSNECVIKNLRLVTIAAGVVTTNGESIWSYQDFSTTGSSITISCNAKSLGDVYHGVVKICCYR